ncbi:MAG: AAA family ATPase, partial [Bacteroidota bacterium]
MPNRRILEDLRRLLEILPTDLQTRISEDPRMEKLIEVVLDLGRPAEARFFDGTLIYEDRIISQADLAYVVARVGTFTEDNRAGIERTLHRISAIRNRVGDVVGLTCRVGRAIIGTVDIIKDLVESNRSILLMGRPGVGKTTKLREIARVLADDFNKRVIVIDTSNEIAGDGDIPHPAIGRARRLQVPTPTPQHEIMIQAVENHMPEVIVIDEIGTMEEAAAARTIAERGVQLIATAHGNSIENLLMNPTLSDLVGGIQSVTLSDEEARRRGTQKTILERKAPPTFDVAVEIQDRDQVVVHSDVAEVVDLLLRGTPPKPEIRRQTQGRVEIIQEEKREELLQHIATGREGRT